MIHEAYSQHVISKIRTPNNINTEEEVKNNPLFFQASLIYDSLLPLRTHPKFNLYLQIIKPCVGGDENNNAQQPYVLFAKDLVRTIIETHLKNKSKNFYKCFGTTYYNDSQDGYYGSERPLGPICADSASQYAMIFSKFIYFLSSIGNNTNDISNVLKELYSFEFDDTTLSQVI